MVAEKLEAIVKLGMLNTRHKDYYDLRHLANHFDFAGDRPPRPRHRGNLRAARNCIARGSPGRADRGFRARPGETGRLVSFPSAPWGKEIFRDCRMLLRT